MNNIEKHAAKTALYVMKRIEKRSIAHGADQEQTHIEADEALVGFVRALGLDELADVYESIDKWYA